MNLCVFSDFWEKRKRKCKAFFGKWIRKRIRFQNPALGPNIDIYGNEFTV